jgi:RND family efflux transporter MFP subunit
MVKSGEKSPWSEMMRSKATKSGMRRPAAVPSIRRAGEAPLILLICAAILGFAGGCDRATDGGKQGDPHGHGGDAHGNDDSHENGHSQGEESPDPISVTLFTEKLELFLEYPHLVKDAQAEFLAHFSVLATGEPIRKGSLTFEVTPASGPPAKKTWETPRREGLFVPEWTFDAPGTFGLRLLVDSPQAQDVVDLGEIVVHPDAHGVEHAAETAGGDEPPDLVPFLMEQQWKIGTLLGQATKRTLVQRLPIPAQIVAPQGASAAVSPPIAGRLLAPPNGRLPRVGDKVEAGQVLAMIEPPLPVTEVFQLSANRAQVQALETELALRELDLDTKALEVERALIQSQAKLDYARRANERVAGLREKGVGTEQQYDEAQQNLRLAEAEQDGAKAMKRSYEDARGRLAKLRSQAMPSASALGTDVASYRMPLLAPISGEVVSVAHIEGEHLDAAHQEVFRVINVDHVWIVGNVSEFDLARLAETPSASLTLPSYPDRRFDILASGGRLVNVGKVVDPQTRSVSVIYELPNRDGLFRVGMFAEVHVETQKTVDAVAIPEVAVVIDNGRPIAFVLIGGESFQRRELELGVRDSGFVEVKGGVKSGERLITKGAYAVKLAAQSPASFGAGHVH